MGNGYTRQSASDIVDDEIIEAIHFNAEFNTLETAFSGSTGHSHDGTLGEGPQINLGSSVLGTLPIANGGTGGTTQQGAVDNLFAGGSVHIDDDLFFIANEADNTKRLRFDISSFTTATDRTITLPDADITISSFIAGILDDADASTLQASISLVPGTDIQAYDADLAAIASLSSTGILARTASDTWSLREIQGTAGEVNVSNGDGVSGNPVISLPSTIFSHLTFSGGITLESNITLNAAGNTFVFEVDSGSTRDLIYFSGNSTRRWDLSMSESSGQLHLHNHGSEYFSIAGQVRIQDGVSNNGLLLGNELPMQVQETGGTYRTAVEMHGNNTMHFGSTSGGIETVIDGAGGVRFTNNVDIENSTLTIGSNSVSSDTDILIRGAGNFASEAQLNFYVDSTGSGTSPFNFRKHGGNQIDGEIIAQINSNGHFLSGGGFVNAPAFSFIDDQNSGLFNDFNGRPAIADSGDRVISFGSSGIDFNADIDSSLNLTNSSVFRIKDSGGANRNIASIDAGDIVNLGAGTLPLMFSSSATPTYGGNDILTTASNLNADNLNSGTVPNGRLTGTYNGFSINASGQSITIGSLTVDGGPSLPNNGFIRSVATASNAGISVRSNATDQNEAAAFYTSDNTEAGTIWYDGAAIQYGTSSDERLKTFIGEYPPEDASAVILADPVREFTWNSTGQPSIGWGAQTSYSVHSCLAKEGRGEPGDEDFKPWLIEKSNRTPFLWAAMKGVLQRLDDLEAENADLLARIEALENA